MGGLLSLVGIGSAASCIPSLGGCAASQVHIFIFFVCACIMIDDDFPFTSNNGRCLHFVMAIFTLPLPYFR